MKNFLLSGAFVLASIFSVQAQDVLLNVDFGTDDETLNEQTADWIFGEFDDDEQLWGFNSPEDVSIAMGFNGIFAISTSFINVEGQEEPEPAGAGNFLISPKIDLTAIDAANLKFKIGSFGQADGMNGYELYVATDTEITIDGEGYSIDLSGLEAVSKAELPNSNADNVIQGTDVTVDLTPYAGKGVYLVFIHSSYNGVGFLMLDDIVVTTGVAGVNENLQTKLSVFPNPVNDVVNVTNSENILVNGVEVADLNGRIVKTTKFENVSNAQINVSDLAAGVYMMTVSSDKGSMTKKIIKN